MIVAPFGATLAHLHPTIGRVAGSCRPRTTVQAGRGRRCSHRRPVGRRRAPGWAAGTVATRALGAL